MNPSRSIVIAGALLAVIGLGHGAEEPQPTTPSLQVDVSVTPRAPGAVYIPPEPPEGRPGAPIHYLTIQVVDRAGVVQVPGVPVMTLYGGQAREGERSAGSVRLAWRAWLSEDLSQASVSLALTDGERSLLRQSVSLWLTDRLIPSHLPDER